MQKTHENKNIQDYFTTYLLLLKSSICKLCQFQLTSPTISWPGVNGIAAIVLATLGKNEAYLN